MWQFLGLTGILEGEYRTKVRGRSFTSIGYVHYFVSRQQLEMHDCSRDDPRISSLQVLVRGLMTPVKIGE